MYCQCCGKQIADDAKFCAHCGSSTVSQFGQGLSSEAQPTPIPNQVVSGPSQTSSMPVYVVPTPQNATMTQTPTYQMGTPTQGSTGYTGNNKGAGNNKNRTVIISSVVIILVIVIAVAIGLVMKTNADKEAAEYAQAHKTYTATCTLKADNFDQNSATPTPVEIKGENFEGEQVDRHELIGKDQPALMLERGTYTITVESTPISEQGVIYDVTNSSGTITITDDETVNAVSAPVIVIVPYDPLSVTDEQIAAAAAALEAHGVPTSVVKTYSGYSTTWVTNARTQKAEADAAAEKAAQEAAAAEAAANAAAAQQSATTSSTSSVTIPDLPANSDPRSVQEWDHEGDMPCHISNCYLHADASGNGYVTCTVTNTGTHTIKSICVCMYMYREDGSWQTVMNNNGIYQEGDIAPGASRSYTLKIDSTSKTAKNITATDVAYIKDYFVQGKYYTSK